MYYKKEVGDIFSKGYKAFSKEVRGPYPKGTDEEFLASIPELKLRKTKVIKDNLEKKLE